MLNLSDLDPHVSRIGLLIGLLNDEGNGAVSVNASWFSDPVTELLKSPTRVKELLDVLSRLLNPVDGVGYTLIASDETWYDLYSGWDDFPTGLCVVLPASGATSGVISLGLFDQLDLDDLTISIYARLPLFYVAENQKPQFILASDLSQDKSFDIEIDVYSSSPIQIGTDAAFNLMTVAATAAFSDEFTTTFNLSFYENFDPQTGSKTPLSVPTADAVIERIAEVVSQANYWLNAFIGIAPVTIGDILSATGLVTKTVDQTSGETTYSFNQQLWNELKTSGPTAILKNLLISLLTNLLGELAASQTLLVQIFNGGIYAVKDAATDSYGLRLAIPDYQLTQPTSGGAQVIVQFGKWFTNEGNSNNWLQRIASETVDAGIDLFFLKYDGATLTTTAYVKMASLGFDIGGPGDAPLINLGGYALQRAEVRTYLDSTNWAYGFAIRLGGIGLPLGPGFQQAQTGSANTNVVAQNLLASGTPPSGASDASAINPVFSAEAGYVEGFSPLLEIFDPQGTQTDLIWFPIQRRFGPINCSKLGLKVDTSDTSNPLLGIVFDGDVSLGALDVYLDQLSVNVALKEVANLSGYSLDLQGLDVNFSSGSVAVNGGLLKSTAADGSVAYDGEALIKFGNRTIAALGSYSALPNHGGTSLFIFAMLNEPLGGPAFFYVTGLAAGFGYNRALKIPGQSDVQEFPLLAGLINSSAIGGDNPSPQQALTALAAWVPPQRGEYWLAAGVQFTTFEIINTNALLIVEFGNDLIIAVLGVSTLKQPQSGETYAYAELDLEVVFQPQQGELQASAVLASSSYVLTPEAHLTGGFAFYSWFGDNQHAGDFVFTIGGYHPAFAVPAHYPQEPRAGINWQISDHLSMIGDAYFAITPTAMMAGGGLQVTFADGSLKAWLKAQADVILYWNPFYLIADVSISVGVSYRIHFLFVDVTLSVEIGADFHLWGPPIGGTAHIDWYVVSFTIGFGASPQPPDELTWDDFKAMLPGKPQAQSALPQLAARAESMMAVAADDPPNTSTPAYLHIDINSGLKTMQTLDGLKLWLVRAGQFQFSIGSALPASVITVESQNPSDNQTLQGTPVGMRRVNGGIAPEDYQSTQTITILSLTQDSVSYIQSCMATGTPCTTQPTGCTDKPIDITDWSITLASQNLPQAMWGNPVPSGQSPNINPTTPTVTGSIGVVMYPKPTVITNCTPEMVIDEVFADRVVNAGDEYRLPLSPAQQPNNHVPQSAASFADIAAVNEAAMIQNRNALFAALRELGVNGWTNDPLPQMAARPGQDFADEPMEGSPVANPS
jgi:hypothetical protein